MERSRGKKELMCLRLKGQCCYGLRVRGELYVMKWVGGSRSGGALKNRETGFSSCSKSQGDQLKCLSKEMTFKKITLASVGWLNELEKGRSKRG